MATSSIPAARTIFRGFSKTSTTRPSPCSRAGWPPNRGGVVGYYSAPNRLRSRNELFAGGAYPPFTPLLLSFRRGAFVEVPSSQYHTAVNNLNLQH